MRALWGVLHAARPGRAGELTALDEQVRRPLALSTRVGFVGTDGGAGCSTAAGLAASVLATRRSTRVLAVNASGSARSMLWHAGITGAATSSSADDARRAAAATAAEALAGVATAPSGLHALDLTQAAQPEDARWWEAVAPGSRFFDFIVTDWGVRDATTLGHVLAASSLLAIVAPPDRVGLQRAVDLAAIAFEDSVPSVLVVCPSRMRIPWGLHAALRLFPTPSIPLPRDRGHGSASPVPSAQLRDATNLAALRLAAELVDVAAARRPGRRARGTHVSTGVAV